MLNTYNRRSVNKGGYTKGNAAQKDAVLNLIKNHDIAIKYAKEALADFGSPESRSFLIKAQKALLVLSRQKMPMIPQLDGLYAYFQRLLFKAEEGDRKALSECITHLEELKTTWIKARADFLAKNNKAA